MSETEIASALVTGQSHLNISACPGCIDSRSTESHVPPPRLRSLNKCAKCGALLCLSKGCKAWKLDEATTCSEHESKVYCRPCNGSGDELRLRPCPVDGCNRILCKDICQKECTGEPVDVAKVVRATLSTNDLMLRALRAFLPLIGASAPMISIAGLRPVSYVPTALPREARNVLETTEPGYVTPVHALAVVFFEKVRPVWSKRDLQEVPTEAEQDSQGSKKDAFRR
ncbi:hypothetical protein GG344DRAFT_84628 [Lentinula edodes]|nr:hypothetical protein GG344DRAFT_84628 [Lentinula edodes]